VKLALRIAIGLLIAAAFAMALVPLLVLLDLGGGGTGWGLCEAGVAVCRNSYFSGFELLAFFAAALFAMIGAIAGLTRILRWLEHREKERQDPELLVG
jgi:hypothetical protein